MAKKQFLDLSQTLYVTREKFISEGVHFGRSDVFDWKRLGLKPKTVNQLFSMRILTHTQPVVTIDEYGIKIAPRGNGFFNVLDAVGDILNSKAMRLAEAKNFFEHLLALIESGTPEGKAIASTYKYEVDPETPENKDEQPADTKSVLDTIKGTLGINKVADTNTKDPSTEVL